MNFNRVGDLYIFVKAQHTVTILYIVGVEPWRDPRKKMLSWEGAAFFLLCTNQNLLLNIFYQLNREISGHFSAVALTFS